MKILTVFTPTYNRAHLLSRVYESLKNQTSNNFIWMVIDDGSIDGTGELVRQWQREAKLEIYYLYKPNEGMHSAHNVAYAQIRTEWNVCIDSDDKMPANAVELILREIAKNPGSQYYGILGLDADFDGKVLGQPIPSHFDRVKMTELESLHGINGDKKLVCKTAIMQSLPAYPIYKNEKLVPLSYKSLVAEQQGLYMQPLNEVLCLVEYQPDGSTKNMLLQYRRNPRGFAFMRVARLNADIRFKDKVKSAVHLVSATMFTCDFRILFSTRHTALVLAAIPFGLVLNLYIRTKTIRHI